MKNIFCFFVAVSFLFTNDTIANPSNTSVGATKVNNTNKGVVSGNTVKQEVNYHIVKEGETIYRIGINYGISQQELIKLNNITNNSIRVGQKLLLPKNAKLKVENVVAEKGGSATQTAENSAKNANLSKVIDTTAVKKNDISSSINVIDYSTFIWPVRGDIIAKFGHTTSTGKLEGVNIATESNANVRATASGEVVFSEKVDGYETVVLIKHYNGFYTAYGYIDSLVSVGDKIKKGQVIAYVKQTDKSKRSVLYFSIRKQGKSYDPEKMITEKISN